MVAQSNSLCTAWFLYIFCVRSISLLNIDSESKGMLCRISEWLISYDTHNKSAYKHRFDIFLSIKVDKVDQLQVVKIKEMLQTIRCLKHYLTLSEDIDTRLCDSLHDHKDVVYYREYTSQGFVFLFSWYLLNQLLMTLAKNMHSDYLLFRISERPIVDESRQKDGYR